MVGLICGAVAIGVAQLAAGLIDPGASPIVAVGSAAIDATPEWLKSFAIRTFGSNDKTALLAGIGVVLAIVASLIGVAAVRRPVWGYVGLAAFGLVGVIAAATRPEAAPKDVLPSVLGAAAGAWMLWWFLRALPRSVDGWGDGTLGTCGHGQASVLPDGRGRPRRSLRRRRRGSAALPPFRSRRLARRRSSPVGGRRRISSAAWS